VRLLLCLLLAIATPAAATPRETLINAAFATPDKAQAIAKVANAEQAAAAELARDPRNREATLQRAIAIGYRAQLTRTLGDAKTAKKMFDALVAAEPGNPEMLMALAGWHLEAVADAGAMLAGAMLGARKSVGLATLDRAVAAARNRSALIPAYAGMMRMRLSPKDIAAARPLLEAALAAPAPTPLDRIMQRNARAMLVPLRAGNGKAASALAKQLLPFGRLAG
jgi:hypothetical protein